MDINAKGNDKLKWIYENTTDKELCLMEESKQAT